jgi:hypothetical protein
VISGRVLDTSALLAFARGTSLYASAAAWTTVEESLVLIVPSTAVAAAWTEPADEYHPVLDVLLQLPVTVIDALEERRVRAIGQLGGPQTDAHAIVCAHERGWPLLTAHPDHYTPYKHTGVDREPLL